jgi:hypothetical protein
VSDFPVVLFVPTNEMKISIAKAKPELLRLSCHDPDDQDPLKLGPQIRERLCEMTAEFGPDRKMSSPIVYLDDRSEGPPDALVSKGQYHTEQNRLVVRIRIEQHDEVIKQDTIVLSSTDARDVSRGQ